MDKIKTPCDCIQATAKFVANRTAEVCKKIAEFINEVKSQVKPEIKETRKFTFKYYNMEAKEVKLAADFIKWEMKPMEKRKDGSWHVTVKLVPGKYNYKFVVDNQWIKDPRNPKTVPDGYGGESSVLELA